MLVIALQAFGQRVRGEELGGDAGVLRQHQIGLGQDIQRAQRDVTQVSDRGGDDVEARRERRVVQRGRREFQSHSWGAFHGKGLAGPDAA